eukprot:TRINITY_DN6676_c0_g1_i1.p1 TRINITY_DN6676_c0_g1~~TRINITY_DN6676_c0_g1_i1.p1  ORF type:complete len:123 (+),score=12.72 TRINITY_DN6676_c0_g1_i1:63-431(+)
MNVLQEILNSNWVSFLGFLLLFLLCTMMSSHPFSFLETISKARLFHFRPLGRAKILAKEGVACTASRSSASVMYPLPSESSSSKTLLIKSSICDGSNLHTPIPVAFMRDSFNSSSVTFPSIF